MTWVRENGPAGGLGASHVDFDGGHIDAVLAIATFTNLRSLFCAILLLIVFGITFEQVSNGN